MDDFINLYKRSQLSSDELLIIKEIRIICCSASICGCILIMILYFIMYIKVRCKKEKRYKINDNDTTLDHEDSLLRSLHRKRTLKMKKNKTKKELKMGLGNDLSFFLILSNLGYSISCVISPTLLDKTNASCIILAFFLNFFDMSSVCWTAVISRITLLGTTIIDIKDLRKRIVLYVLYANIFPLVVSLMPYITESYGPAGAWCWIDIEDYRTFNYIWTILIYLFNWIQVIYNIYCAIKVGNYFEKRQVEIAGKSEKEKELNYLKKYVLILRLFPIITVITRFPATINRIWGLIFGTDIFVLYILHVSFYSLVGLCNSMIYAFFYRSVFRCKKRISQSIYSGSTL